MCIFNSKQFVNCKIFKKCSKEGEKITHISLNLWKPYSRKDQEAALSMRKVSAEVLKMLIMTGVRRSAFISHSVLDILDNGCRVIIKLSDKSSLFYPDSTVSKSYCWFYFNLLKSVVIFFILSALTLMLSTSNNAHLIWLLKIIKKSTVSCCFTFALILCWASIYL